MGTPRLSHSYGWTSEHLISGASYHLWSNYRGASRCIRMLALGGDKYFKSVSVSIRLRCSPLKGVSSGPLILVMPVSRLQIDFDQLKVRLHTTTLVAEFWFWPTFTTKITIVFRVHRTTLVVGVDLTSTIVPSIGAICGAEANNLWILVKSLSKSKCPLQIISYAWVSKFFPEAIVTTHNIELMK
jgi:hypothetical protein